MYRIDADYIDYQYTHAYFPTKEFDEAIEKYELGFGKKDKGLYCIEVIKTRIVAPVKKEFYQAVYPRHGMRNLIWTVRLNIRPRDMQMYGLLRWDLKNKRSFETFK